MDPEQADHLRTLFEAAMDLPPERQREYLEQACPDDPALRDEVLSLLAADAAAPPDFLPPPDPTAGDTRMTTPAADNDFDPLHSAADPHGLIGHRVGRYRIIRLIATGGMGTVYLARDEHLNRDVALKVLRPPAFSSSALRRFEVEALILANLRHPHIAQVYDAGFLPDDAPGAGLPWFAMEYIPDPLPIIRWADEHDLSLTDRLRLFVHVCDAVHHAHLRSTIHRDLKPSNILVDPAGNVKIIDFGVARCTDSDIAATTLATTPGQIIGTLQYMSPEQCAGDPASVDARSDIYSLGVVLYELLTGRLPYDVRTAPLPEATRLICDQPPEAPRLPARRLGRDAAIILETCLAKDPARRYPSAAELAADIRRALAGEPLSARRPGLAQRAIRWAIRHPRLATAAASLAIAFATLLATTAAIWWLNLEPYGIRVHVVRSGEVEARLVSRAGRILHTWPDVAPAAVNALLVRQPPEMGGRRLAVMTFRPSLADPKLAGRLCVFDVDGDLEQPIWTAGIDDEWALPDPHCRAYKPAQFGSLALWILDIFPDRPGPEVLVAFANHYSQRILRIYDLAGRLLWQAWHEGGVWGAWSPPGTGLLVLAGENAEAWYDQRRIPADALPPPGANDRYPCVVFAIRPRPGFIAHDWIRTPDRPGWNPAEAATNPLQPLWYHYLRVPRSLWGDDSSPRGLAVHVLPPAHPDAAVTLNVIVPPAGAPLEGSPALSIHLDTAGNEVGTRMAADSWWTVWRADPGFPHPDEITLEPLPPVRPQYAFMVWPYVSHWSRAFHWMFCELCAGPRHLTALRLRLRAMWVRLASGG